MNKYISYLIDNISIYQKNSKRSETSQFYNSFKSPLSIDNASDFYTTPEVPEITFNELEQKNKYKTGEFSFESEIQNNGDSNKYCKGVYYTSDSVNPVNIVIVHGFKSDKLDRIYRMFLDRFMELGYNLYFVKLPHHFERKMPKSLFSGEYMLSANIDRTLLSIQQAVSNVKE